MILSTKLRVFCVLVLVIGLGASLAFYAHYKGHSHVKTFETRKDMSRNAIVSNGIECAAIGKDILHNHNGTAVDAMIAILFCEGITVVQSMGLGGSFVATLYRKDTNMIETLTARARAPLKSTENMFNKNDVPQILSVATPGELKGYWAMHQKYGRVPWKTLVEPSIELCRNGHIVTSYLANTLIRFQDTIKKEPSLHEIFVNPATKEVWRVDDRIKRPQLAKTLEIIAEEGVDSIYSANGTIAKLLVDDIKALGGIVTIDDFVQYTVEWKKPVTTKLRDDLTLYSTPLPSSGNVLAMILNVMEGYETDDSVLFFHRLAEAYKFAYARRSHLGDVYIDPVFVNAFTNKTFAKHIRDRIWDYHTFNELKHYDSLVDNGKDAGTAHVSVLAQNGDAVSVTSTVNSLLGAKLRSSKTGILLNDEMHVFSRPGVNNTNTSNFIKPGKRPFSSMCPTIIMDSNNNVMLVIGGTGGRITTTSTAYSIIRHLWKKDSLLDSIRAKRFHYSLDPMFIDYEGDFDARILSGLEAKGHVTKNTNLQEGISAVTAISKAHHILEVATDPRRNGSVVTF